MKVYGVYRNTDPIEGKGGMVLDKLFESRSNAEQYRQQQKDYPGWPMWKVKELDVVPAAVEAHVPLYAQGGCSCGWRAVAPRAAPPEVWDAAVDKHIADAASSADRGDDAPGMASESEQRRLGIFSGGDQRQH